MSRLQLRMSYRKSKSHSHIGQSAVHGVASCVDKNYVPYVIQGGICLKRCPTLHPSPSHPSLSRTVSRVVGKDCRIVNPIRQFSPEKWRSREQTRKSAHSPGNKYFTAWVYIQTVAKHITLHFLCQRRAICITNGPAWNTKINSMTFNSISYIFPNYTRHRKDNQPQLLPSSKPSHGPISQTVLNKHCVSTQHCFIYTPISSGRRPDPKRSWSPLVPFGVKCNNDAGTRNFLVMDVCVIT